MSFLCVLCASAARGIFDGADMMKKNGIAMSVAAGLACVMLATAGCGKGRGADGDGGKDPISWNKTTLTAGDKKYPVEVGRYEKPLAFKPLALDQVRRGTPFDAWISWQSYRSQGKDDKDLQAYVDHFTDGAQVRAGLKNTTAQQFFDDARKEYDRPTVIAQIRHDQWTIILFQTGRGGYYRSAPMILRNGKWFIDEKSKVTDPVLKRIVESDQATLDAWMNKASAATPAATHKPIVTPKPSPRPSRK